jgi:hypothetical protein
MVTCDQAKGFQENDSDDDSDDDIDEDEEMQSPIDEIDPFIFFIETIHGTIIFFSHMRFAVLENQISLHYYNTGVLKELPKNVTFIFK